MSFILIVLSLQAGTQVLAATAEQFAKRSKLAPLIMSWVAAAQYRPVRGRSAPNLDDPNRPVYPYQVSQASEEHQGILFTYFKVMNHPENDFPVRVFFNPSANRHHWEFTSHASLEKHLYLYPDDGEPPAEFILAAAGSPGDSLTVRIWPAVADENVIPGGFALYQWTRPLHDRPAHTPTNIQVAKTFDPTDGFWCEVIPSSTDTWIVDNKFHQNGKLTRYERHIHNTTGDLYNEGVKSGFWDQDGNNFTFWIISKANPANKFLYENGVLALANPTAGPFSMSHSDGPCAARGPMAP